MSKQSRWAAIFPLGMTISTLLAAPASAAEQLGTVSPNKQVKTRIKNAISAFENTDRTTWSYSVSRYENEEGDITSSLETFTPNDEESKRWQLIEINGTKPSLKQHATYAKKKDKQSKGEDSQHFSLSLNELIELDSVSLSSEDDLNFKASFDVNLEKLGEDASKQLTGTLTYNKAAGFIERIDIVNSVPFTPMFSASIDEFHISMQFIKIHDAILPQQYSLTMQGTFAFFTEINETSLDTYADYVLHDLN